MQQSSDKVYIIQQIFTAVRIVLASMVICCILYTAVIWSTANMVVPRTANGSLIYNDQGSIIGSELLAQKFSRPDYFWPRPSSVDYSAAASGGSNISPTDNRLRLRAKKIMADLGTEGKGSVPADLVTASGSGLDPHITLAAAKYQAERVASARHMSRAAVLQLLEEYSYRPGGIPGSELLINVMLVNIALDKVVIRQ